MTKEEAFDVWADTADGESAYDQESIVLAFNGGWNSAVNSVFAISHRRMFDEGVVKGMADSLVEIDCLKQYKEAIISATEGTTLVWNLVDTNCTVIKHSYWLAHLKTIEKLEKALEAIAKMEPWTANYSDYIRIAKTALEERYD